MLVCVPNVSEGRRRDAVDTLAAACGATLLDVHSDPDHHRSVLTLAGPPDAVEAAARRLAEVAVARVDLTGHAGVHPRLGALDVVPFVFLEAASREVAIAAARRFAGWLAGTLEVPAFLYADADPGGRSLPELRRTAFSPRRPDFGPGSPHATAGSTAVGARRPLVAVNCDLDAGDLEHGGLDRTREIAAAVRESGGGLRGVRALGLELATRGRSQVSLNLVDLEATGLERACLEVRRLARERGCDIARVEVVGLVPRAELARCSAGFLAWSGLDASVTIEARLEARPP